MGVQQKGEEVIKWEYAVKQCAAPALQTVLYEYGKWGWEFAQALEIDQSRGLTVIFKRPEKWGHNAKVRTVGNPPVLSVAATKAQLGLDDLASVEDEEGTGADAAARSRHPASSFDGVSSTPRVC